MPIACAVGDEARGAGFDAGFALATDIKSMKRNPQRDAILDAIRIWEAARMQQVFSPEQRARLRNPEREFHLEQVSETAWDLYPYHASERFEFEEYIRQPGEPTPGRWEFENPGKKQPVQFRIAVQGEAGGFEEAVIEIDDYLSIEIPVALAAGQQLVCDETGAMRLYDAKGQQVKLIEAEGPLPDLSTGRHEAELTGEFTGDGDAKVVLWFVSIGDPERLEVNE